MSAHRWRDTPAGECRGCPSHGEAELRRRGGGRQQAGGERDAQLINQERLTLIDSLSEPRLLGLFGEPRVNVVLLNRALEAR